MILTDLNWYVGLVSLLSCPRATGSKRAADDNSRRKGERPIMIALTVQMNKTSQGTIWPLRQVERDVCIRLV